MEKVDIKVYRIELFMARTILRKVRCGEDLQKSDAAKKILHNRRLFDEFVRMRIERRKKLQDVKEEKVTTWKRFANLIGVKA